MYNAYVPVFLKDTFAIVLLPFLGALSDRTRTRLGRRRPSILAGSILATVFFVLIPFSLAKEMLGLMMATIILMNLSMALFRSPVIALMPDTTPSRYRSQANGIINFMGGLGALLVYFGQKATPLADSLKEMKENLRDVFGGEKSLLLILVSILCWFVGFNALETFFTSYARYHLGMKESTGALILGFFSVTFMITSIASGFIGSRLGRRRTIRRGLAVLLALVVGALFARSFALLTALFVLAIAVMSFVQRGEAAKGA
jgi:maltose/moltooligosaccharide transporter